MSQGPCIGYVGVDVLNNATICNEASGLVEAGVTLEVSSVLRITRARFYHDATLASWGRLIEYLTPLRFSTVICDLARAPRAFGRRFWGTLWAALRCPAEGPRQKLRILWH